MLLKTVLFPSTLLSPGLYMDGLASQTSSLAMMDDFQKQALRQCHPDLRMSVRVADFLLSLHVHAGRFLNDVEYDSINL